MDPVERVVEDVVRTKRQNLADVIATCTLKTAKEAMEDLKKLEEDTIELTDSDRHELAIRFVVLMEFEERLKDTIKDFAEEDG